ncbi:hypothetical protein [Helicobacter sp. 11S03491-1]|uniref:hypothetical protein n=1 Tax=Helicobacter sp. 11S03491-1 TaxID=1476196 RepID=UPI000BA70B3D|nr:hypothetical protein [Helicobacter sp. 11S03491-1]PAF43380.1 hypothetical protein BKH45_01715 [Helicobacter sp. 11S03491-1]
MNRFLFLFILSVFVLAKEPTWTMNKDIYLKKDELYEGSIYQNQLQKPLSLRWTLYKNHGLVVYLNYDKFPYQFILYQDYQRDTFKLELFKGDSHLGNAYLFISFKDYNQKTNQALLWLGISGDAQFLQKN